MKKVIIFDKGLVYISRIKKHNTDSTWFFNWKNYTTPVLFSYIKNLIPFGDRDVYFFHINKKQEQFWKHFVEYRDMEAQQ